MGACCAIASRQGRPRISILAEALTSRPGTFVQIKQDLSSEPSCKRGRPYVFVRQPKPMQHQRDGRQSLNLDAALTQGGLELG